MQPALCFVFFAASLALLAGCQQGSELVPVNGRVTLEGKAVKDMIVNFTPLGNTEGNGSMGYAGPDGQFTLKDARGQAGAYVGEYRVSFYPGATRAKPDDPGDVVGRGSGSSVPAIYLDPRNSPVRATVPAGGGTIEISITRSGKGATTKTINKANTQ